MIQDQTLVGWEHKFSHAKIFNKHLENKIIKRIVKPTLLALKKEKNRLFDRFFIRRING